MDFLQPATWAEALEARAGHPGWCRRTGYQKIINAVRLAARRVNGHGN